MGKPKGAWRKVFIPQNVRFRPINVSDLEYRARYAAGCNEITEETKIHEIKERIRANIEEPDYLGIVALHGERRIGHVEGRIQGTQLMIEDIYVEEAYRSRGIGRCLLESIITLARDRGVTMVMFYTEPDNVPMQKIAKRLGFSLTRLYYEKRLAD